MIASEVALKLAQNKHNFDSNAHVIGKDAGSSDSEDSLEEEKSLQPRVSDPKAQS